MDNRTIYKQELLYDRILYNSGIVNLYLQGKQ